MGPPIVDDVVAERYELKAPLRGCSVTRTFLANDDQTAALVALTWFAPENVTTAVWAAFARVVAAAADVPGLILHRGLPAAPPHPPHGVAEVPLGQGFDRVRQSTWKDVLVLGERVLEILEQAYVATRVAHRALTPSRLCTDRGQVRVLDFGVAEFERTNPDEPAYRAPEQPASEDPRVDIYTLAVILFEMIAATLPKPDQRLRDFVAVPREVDELITRALRPDPGQRFPDYATFRAALRAAGGMPPLQPPTRAPAPVDPAPLARPVTPAPTPIVAPAWSMPVAPRRPLPEPLFPQSRELPTEVLPPAPRVPPTEILPPAPREPPTEVLPPGPRVPPTEILRAPREPPTEILPPAPREPPTEVLPPAPRERSAAPSSRASPPQSTEVLPFAISGAKLAEPPSPAPALPRSSEPLPIAPIVSRPELPPPALRPNARPRRVPMDELETMAFLPIRPSPEERPTQVLARPAASLRAAEPTSGLESQAEVKPRIRDFPSTDVGTRLAGDNTLRDVRTLAQAAQAATPEDSVSAPALVVTVRARTVPWLLIAINVAFVVIFLIIALLVG